MINAYPCHDLSLATPPRTSSPAPSGPAPSGPAQGGVASLGPAPGSAPSPAGGPEGVPGDPPEPDPALERRLLLHLSDLATPLPADAAAIRSAIAGGDAQVTLRAVESLLHKFAAQELIEVRRGLLHDGPALVTCADHSKLAAMAAAAAAPPPPPGGGRRREAEPAGGAGEGKEAAKRCRRAAAAAAASDVDLEIESLLSQQSTKEQQSKKPPAQATPPAPPRGPAPPDAGADRLFPPQWICCDIRYLDVSILGKFAVVMADPPWDIHMELPYGTLTDDEMRRLNIPVLQDEGFLFLWVTGRSQNPPDLPQKSRDLITLGNQLDGIHLLDPDVVARFKQHYPDGVIAKPKNL
uniref:N6-adenosine-methyltransferase catalytic subunit n=1 Tax=Lonchura striata TaxID=40157 RepID=UPI001293CE50|nr:N6-adenosine-methyltransferase catalytic subunit [Lonchura striata domestica]